MKPRLALSALCLLLTAVSASLADDTQTSPWWVFFDCSHQAGSPAISDRAASRIARRGAMAAAQDFAPPDSLLARLRIPGVRVRTVSRWFCAASVDATHEQAGEIASWPGVREVRRVASYGRTEPPPSEPQVQRPAAGDSPYGPAEWQVSRIGVPELHERGLTGAGVLICVADNGFGRGVHEAVRDMNVVARRNFVTGADTLSTAHHGARVMAVMGAHVEGSIIGPAYGADYALAWTEVNDSETRQEEDYLVAALEWADSLGADVVNISLGYETFDDPAENHSLDELDGSSMLTTAADLAVARGIVVVTSAGNTNDKPELGEWNGHISLPADGHGVIAVGAITPQDEICTFSSLGPTADGRIKPDVTAPGEGIYSPVPGTDSEYDVVRGTSFSSPLVAGVVALLLEAHPEWTPGDISQALTLTAEDMGEPGPDNTFGWGIINAAAAVDAFSDSVLWGRVLTQLVPSSQGPNTPVSHAHVTLTGPATAQTVADEDGRFHFDGLTPGDYTLSASAPGFTAQNLGITIPLGRFLDVVISPESDDADAYLLIPNPVTPQTAPVTLGGAISGDLTASFYTAMGEHVITLGPGEAEWDLRTPTGAQVASGIYVCVIRREGRAVWRGRLAVVR